MINNKKWYFNSKFYNYLVIFYIIIVLVVIVFSVDIFRPFYSFTNKSDSMNPLIDRGSITIVKSFPSYQVGDMITYYAKIDGQEEIITHRITGIGGNVYTTKGDANEVADRELVLPRLVIGRVVYIIPYLGYAIVFLKKELGNFLFIILPALFIIVSELFRIFLEFYKVDKK